MIAIGDGEVQAEDFVIFSSKSKPKVNCSVCALFFPSVQNITNLSFSVLPHVFIFYLPFVLVIWTYQIYIAR